MKERWLSPSRTDAAATRVWKTDTLVEYNLPDGCCGAYYPEAQPLVALGHHDPESRTPAYKSIPVRIRATEGVREADLVVEKAGVLGDRFPGEARNEGRG